MGYIGGGLLLLINVIMIFVGPRFLPNMSEADATSADDAPQSGQCGHLVGRLFHSALPARPGTAA